ncbi:MAG TPA: hypothetical protein VH087_09940 [Thermoanaerobaculia bacterium]|nr:hypothetical protein [Thermoanaerobaculia bacterium]
MLMLLIVAAALPMFAAEDDAPIQDNSFLVEEAYNQEPGVVQHIFTFQRTHAGTWAGTFTEEWPVGGLRHQFSYAPIFVREDGRRSNDFALNYRLQLVGNGESRVAVAPRVTLLRDAVQVMLPASLVVTPRIVTHWNLGATSYPRTFNAGQSVVWLVSHRINFLVETVWTHTDHATDVVVSPGVRWSYNLAHGLQIVPGIAVPYDRTQRRKSAFLYLSFEHPFRGES